jgi:hypothetical protein
MHNAAGGTSQRLNPAFAICVHDREFRPLRQLSCRRYQPSPFVPPYNRPLKGLVTIYDPLNTSDEPTQDCCFAQFSIHARIEGSLTILTPIATSYAPSGAFESTSVNFRA